MNKNYLSERAILVHTADSIAEAMVIRGLLESAGIRSPDPSAASNLIPMSELPGGGVDIYVVESQAEHARKLIEEYLRADEGSAEGDADPEPRDH